MRLLLPALSVAAVGFTVLLAAAIASIGGNGVSGGDYILSSKVSVTRLTSDAELGSIPPGRVAISLTVRSLASGLSDKIVEASASIGHILSSTLVRKPSVITPFSPKIEVSES